MPVVEGGTGAQTLTGVLTGNGTSAITANAVTQYNVIVGGASNAVGSVAPSATTGVPLVSQGAAINPAFGTAVVAGGGTGIVTTTAYAPICGGTTATGAFQAASTGLSTSGYVLTSNGASALPSFQALPASGITSVTGDTGGAQTGPAITLAGGTTGLSFGGAANTITTTFAGITANGGTVSLATDATTSTINVGTGAGVKTSTFGSTNSTSATTVQSGSGALNVTATNGALTVNSGTGTMNISSDASATTVNIATGAAAKTVTLGSTNSTSSLALKYGTSDFTLASATGTVMSALDTGEVTFPLTSAFFARNTTSPTNVTGDGTNYTMTFTTEQFDLNSDYDGTSTFTAPITGRYTLGTSVDVSDLTASNTLGRISIVTTARTYDVLQVGIGKIFYVNVANLNGAIFVDMTAGDTATVQLNVAGSTKIVDIQGDYGNSPTYFYGRLDC